MAVLAVWLGPALALGFALLLASYIGLFLKRRRIIKDYPLPGSTPSTVNLFWPFGTELEILKLQSSQGLKFGEALYRTVDSVCRENSAEGLARMWMMFRPLVVVFRSRTVQPILKSLVEINKSEEVAMVETWLGKGLLTSNGALWNQKRKMLTPVFHFNILDDFMPTMNEQAGILTEILQKNEHRPLELAEFMAKCALDIICETAMGVSIGAQQNDSEYVKSLAFVAQGFIKRFLTPWLWSDLIYGLTPSGRTYYRHLKVVHGLTRKVIDTRLAEMEKQLSEAEDQPEEDRVAPKARKPLLDLLLEKYLRDKSITLEAIREEVDTFMFTGHDTTATALTWALYYIGLDPEVQSKIHDELDLVFGDERTRPVTNEDLPKLKYLECVMKETLRLCPSAPVVGRRLLHDIEIGPYRVSAGSSMFIDLYHTHRDPEVFQDPEKFDPDRFLPENASKLDSFAYVPFSAGPRNCVGQKYAVRELKVILATVFRSLQVKSLVPLSKVRPMFAITLQPVDPLLIEVRSRPESNGDYFR